MSSAFLCYPNNKSLLGAGQLTEIDRLDQQLHSATIYPLLCCALLSGRVYKWVKIIASKSRLENLARIW